MSKEKPTVKAVRYNLTLSKPMFDKVTEAAQNNHSTVHSKVVQYIRLGLEIHDAKKNGDQIIKKTGDKEIELLII